MARKKKQHRWFSLIVVATLELIEKVRGRRCFLGLQNLGRGTNPTIKYTEERRVLGWAGSILSIDNFLATSKSARAMHDHTIDQYILNS
jgi:hypothetical protein